MPKRPVWIPSAAFERDLDRTIAAFTNYCEFYPKGGIAAFQVEKRLFLALEKLARHHTTADEDKLIQAFTARFKPGETKK